MTSRMTRRELEELRARALHKLLPHLHAFHPRDDGHFFVFAHPGECQPDWQELLKHSCDHLKAFDHRHIGTKCRMCDWGRCVYCFKEGLWKTLSAKASHKLQDAYTKEERQG